MLAAAATLVAAGSPAHAAWPAAPGDMSLGDPKAPVHVVEYLSLTCPHCAHFHETVYPAFKAKYVDAGKVYFTIRELLTAPANVAAAGFLMARCNGGTKYFEIVSDVFDSQSRWSSGQIKPIFLEIGAKYGISEAQFNACVADEKAQAALQGRLEYAVNTDKVSGTPTFFVNGKLVGGDHVPTLEELDEAIAKAAAPKPAPSKTGKAGRR